MTIPVYEIAHYLFLTLSIVNLTKSDAPVSVLHSAYCGDCDLGSTTFMSGDKYSSSQYSVFTCSGVKL